MSYTIEVDPIGVIGQTGKPEYIEFINTVFEPTPTPTNTPEPTESVITPEPTESVITPEPTQPVITPEPTEPVITPVPANPPAPPTGSPAALGIGAAVMLAGILGAVLAGRRVRKFN